MQHFTGPLSSEESYHPFGGTMAALSSKAFGKPANRNKYNGGTELNDDLELNYYETYFRNYDAQIGRFTGVDALAEQSINLSPYHFGNNNPIFFNDPTGAITQGEFDNIVSTLSNSAYGGQWSANDPTHLYIYADNNTARTFGYFASLGMQFDFGGGGGGGSSGSAALYSYTNASGSVTFQTTGYHGDKSYTEGENYSFTSLSVTNFVVPEVSLGTRILDGFQTTLDVVGLVPGLGEIADGANALIYIPDAAIT